MPSFLTKKYGPLPLGLWVLLAVVAGAIYKLYKSRKAAAAASTVSFAAPDNTGVDGITGSGTAGTDLGNIFSQLGDAGYQIIPTTPGTISDPSSDTPVTVPPTLEKPWESTHPGEILPGQKDPKLDPKNKAYERSRGGGKPPDMSKLPPGGIVGYPPAGADPSNYYTWDGRQWRGGSARDSRGSSNAYEWVLGGTPTHPDAPYHIQGET